MKIRILAFIVSMLIICSPYSSSFAANYYISPNGNDSSGNGSSINPWRTTEMAFTSGGSNTYIFKDGIYNYPGCEIRDVPNGTEQNYTIIKSENDGGAIINCAGGFSLFHDNQYIQMEGFKFDYPDQKNILGNHIKFLRCAFADGPDSGNTVNTVIGTNDYSDTNYILIEDCWFYGLGGRYNLLVYNSDKIIIRRCVIRHDGGWNDFGSANPEAGLNFYNSSNCLAQNVIVIDSDEAYHTWCGGFYSVNNNSTNHPSDNNKWQGCIHLVGADMGLRFDTSHMTGAIVEDCVFWDTRNGGISFGGSGSGNAIINRVTIGRSRLNSSGDFQGGIGAWNSGNKTITNAIIANWTTGSDLDGLSAAYFNTHNNKRISNGTARQTYKPQTNGLRYLVRIENRTSLKIKGIGNGQIGAQIMKRRGKNNTLFGENGYDIITTDNLWPWPNENRIKTDLSTTSTRGFCATGTTLTKYIWEYLGNTIPPEVYGAKTQ